MVLVLSFWYKLLITRIYTVSTKKQSQRIFSIIVIRTDEILEFGGLISESTQYTNGVAFSTKPV